LREPCEERPFAKNDGAKETTMTPVTSIAPRLRALPEPAFERFNTHYLDVTFEDAHGERRTAVGGGESVAEAIAAGRDELPAGGRWTLVRWTTIYGE
jgi:hypothetical protein